MKTKAIILSVLTVFAAASFADVKDAKVSEKLKAMWANPVLQEQLDINIKANRMGSFTLDFRKKATKYSYKGYAVKDVKVELVKHDFLFGCNAFLIDGFRNEDGSVNQADADKYGETFKKLFNYATLAFYWPEFEPTEGKMRFSKDSEYMYRRPAAETSLDFCKKYDLTPKGHCLVWHINDFWGQPKWAIAPKDPEYIKDLTFKRIKAIADYCGGKIKYWDVVNEAGSYCNADAIQFDDYLYASFKEAARVFPGNSVFINNETDRAWTQANKDGITGRFYATNEYLIAKGAKLDVIGIQYHVFDEKRWENILAGNIETPNFFLNALDIFAKEKRPIHITEITIPSMGGEPEENQAFWVECLYKLWFSHPSVEAITWWNLVDGTAASGEDKWKGGLVNRDFSPKKAFLVLDRLINKQWRTKAEFAGEHTSVNFRGFYGTYLVTYTVDGITKTEKIRLSKGMFNRPVNIE